MKLEELSSGEVSVSITDLDRRIVAAHAVLADYLPPSLERIVVADKMCRAAFPELFTDPPQAWIAPWEATEEMHVAGTANDKMILHTVGGVYAAMRDTHLSQEGKGE